jgi:hypothetical protein
MSFHVTNQCAVDPIDLILHHCAFPIETTGDVVEHEGDLRAAPKLAIPLSVEDLIDPIAQCGF